ncbi:10300_t:CDS:2 [Ambispora gerdemannii]|uniref:10300_t:CDS:1 n=1 Tax=Ambispora gerdemannii TaxID=144530 RepID=A0A9N8YRI5_9GLOM|nr:10300_t:CDS:2 [Ambispora gerdemannii]
MSNVHTLRDIENRGHRLGSIRESELGKALRGSIKTASDIANEYKDLQDIYLERVKDFNRISSGINNKEATLAQKASSVDKVKILSLEAKIGELEVEEVTEAPGKQKDPKLPDWIDDNLKGLVYELGLENKEDLLEVLQNALSERNSLFQEADLKGSANAYLAEQTPKTSSEFEVVGGVDSKENPGVSEQEKDNGNTSIETTWVHNANVSVAPISIPETGKALADKKLDFFFFKKIFPKYITPFNRNQSYGFPIRYTEKPKERTTTYETLPYGYG